MRITGSDLQKEYQRASHDWPFITDIEHTYGLPPFLLYAVGSRETNLTNEIGDGGHGHGVFQLDDRYHTIHTGFDTSVFSQATVAAGMLATLHSAHQDWASVCNIYNSGSPNVLNTTGQDYGPDVIERMTYLQSMFEGEHMDWSDPIVDHYQDGTPGGPHTLPAGELLSWGPTHAAHAHEQAIAARNDIASLRQDLPGIIAQAVAEATIHIAIETKTA